MMIVKVQLSLMSEVGQQMLIYNQDQSIVFTRFATDDVIDAMHGQPKAFFYAEHERGGTLRLGRRAPEQSW